MTSLATLNQSLVRPRSAHASPLSAQAQWEEELTSPGAGRGKRGREETLFPSLSPFSVPFLQHRAAGGRVPVLLHCEPSAYTRASSLRAWGSHSSPYRHQQHLPPPSVTSCVWAGRGLVGGPSFPSPSFGDLSVGAGVRRSPDTRLSCPQHVAWCHLTARGRLFLELIWLWEQLLGLLVQHWLWLRGSCIPLSG